MTFRSGGLRTHTDLTYVPVDSLFETVDSSNDTDASDATVSGPFASSNFAQSPRTAFGYRIDLDHRKLSAQPDLAVC